MVSYEKNKMNKWVAVPNKKCADSLVGVLFYRCQEENKKDKIIVAIYC